MAIKGIEVVVFRIPGTQNGEEWRVFVDGRITTPSFNSKGAARAYREMIQTGYRKPEFSMEDAPCSM